MSEILAGGVAFVGLVFAYVVAARLHASPPRGMARRLVLPSEIGVGDWLEGHGWVTSVKILDSTGVLVRTASELIVCGTDVEVPVLRRHDSK